MYSAMYELYILQTQYIFGYACFEWKQVRQCTYNVTLRCVRVAIVAVEKQ